ncbi:MAG TPA: trehalose-phosphatase [Candidatus Limnocylindrales bacterium]|nr:trehalose-phosphatase [Candidatus Limnocylindrales bacterium]
MIDAGLPAIASSPTDIAAAIERLASAPAPLLVVADFDGTLAVGTRDPAAAVILPSAQRALRALARRGVERPDRVRVAILTGRVVADVAARVRVGGVEYLGDHGLEHGLLPRGGRVERMAVATDGAFDGQRDPAEAFAVGVPRVLGRPDWLFVERKGPSVAFHVRQADDVASARAAVVEAIRTVETEGGLGDHGLVHYRGRSVVDLRPATAGGKREAVERLIARHRPGAVVVLGDELSDVDAFEAVIAARAAGRPTDGVTVGVTVAVHGATRPAPRELLAVADVALAGPPDVGRLLATLAVRLRPSRPAEATGRTG